MCPFIHVLYIYVYDPPKSLNDTLVVDSPFQTLAVYFSSNLLTSSTTARSEMLSLLSKSLFNAPFALFVRRMTQLWLHSPIGNYRHLVNGPWNGVECECEELCLRRGSPHVWGNVICKF